MFRRWMHALLLGLAAIGSTAAAAAEETGSLKVMSFNIRYGTAKDGADHWDKRKDFLADTIRAFDPDLLGTQETLGFQKDFLAQKMETHEAWGVGRDDGGPKGEMTALFYRKSRFEKLDAGHFWLSETPEKPGSKSWDTSLTRMVSWVKLKDKSAATAKPILFLNTHFDHQGVKARWESAKLIRKKIEELAKGDSVILTGDFNEGANSNPYLELFESKPGQALSLLDTFREANPKPSPEEGTFNGFKASQTRGTRIDWIGCTPDWHVKAAVIDRTVRDGRTPSDHFPVTATLARKATAARPKSTVLVGGNFAVKELRDIAYREGEDADPAKHKLDLFLPEGQKDFPVMFFIHGGSWSTGDRRMYGALGRVFAKNGVGVAIISYRLSPKVTHPAHIEDVARAFAWTVANIGSHGGRADRIFVCGHSAGGHLGSLLATDASYLKAVNLSLKNIRAVMPLSGVYQFNPGSFEKVLGPNKETALAASPIRHICEECPPFEIMYADNDYRTLDKSAIDFHAALGRRGIPARCTKVEGRNHISIMVNLMTNEEDLVAQTWLGFIARHSELKLSPKILENH